MAGPACVVPEQSVRLYDLAREGRWDKALQYQRRLWRINELFVKHPMAACIKAALGIQGLDVGAPIPPQESLPEAAVREVRRVMEELGAATPSALEG